ENTNDAFRKFNNNEVDVLLINQSGSTGASAHAIVTPKVSKEKVKQRVMIVLQAELDISTEVQKRGRINRTGQILKPIYDYVNSAIPAEKRLMMMLQKKLKSLDANTTSNQKSSTKILDVPDFLNKYGDKVVDEYLAENPEINALLDFPLASGEKEEAAHKVSGRVAVLSTDMQQKFYNEISERYNDYVDYLKQSDEYDLEVEAMDLQAETVSLRPVIVGKGGISAFGDDSVLETVRANVLKKPFTKVELNNLLTESLQGKEAQTLQEEILTEYKAFRKAELTQDILNNTVRFNQLKDEIPTEKKLQKIQEKEGQAVFDKAVAARTKEIEQARIASEEKIKQLDANRAIFIELIMKHFYVGRLVNYPVSTFDSGLGTVPAVFLGFIIDKRRRNPYTPSSLRLRFALANGNKYMVLAGSQHQLVRGVMGASLEVSQPDRKVLLDLWERTIKESAADRKIRHIITGNVLQAFSEFRGKLVNYTTSSGATKKGILLPEYWLPEEGSKEETIVPLFRAVKVIRSLIVGASTITNNGVAILRTNDHFKIMVSASRAKGGDVFLDPDILALVNKNNFEKVSDKMTALLPINKIDRLVEILQEKFNDSLSLNTAQYTLIRNDVPKRIVETRPKSAMINSPRKESININVLELEALALELELELLNFAA
ncbi:MAG TPA: strawberry notch C-terminal domain-containing protein, partial [Cyclobacteriaceae bacterium]